MPINHCKKDQEKMNWLTDKYCESLYDKQEMGSESALAYLYDRGIGDDIISKFKIGWNAPDRIVNDEEELSGRIIFPIISEFGDTVAYSGRIPLPKREIIGNKPHWWHQSYPKPFFSYGLHLTWPYILHDKSVFIVEGQVDVISCFRHGIKNVVGIMGSSLSEENLAKLMRYARTFNVFMDGDSSGRKSAESIMEKITSYLGEEYVNYIPLKFGEIEYDPDEFLNKYGYDGFLKLYEKTLDKKREGKNEKNRNSI